MPKRSYTDDERAMALAMLAANGGNTKRTSRDTAIPESTLRCWRDGERHPEARAASLAMTGSLADAFENLARRCLAAVTDAKLAEADLLDLMRCSGISVDKMRLLRDEPTAVVCGDDYGALSDAELERRIEEAEARQRRRVG